MKFFFSLAILLALPFVSRAQYVSFFNLSTSRISTNGVLQAAAPIGTWYYALFAAPSTQNTFDGIHLSGWSLAAYGTNRTTAGRMTGNNHDGGTAVLVPGFGLYEIVDLAVVGWSGDLGTDVFNVLSGFHGFNQEPDWATYGYIGLGVAQDIYLAPDGGPYNLIFGPASAGQIPGLNLIHPTPEPSAFALASLGLAALGMIRGRHLNWPADKEC